MNEIMIGQWCRVDTRILDQQTTIGQIIEIVNDTVLIKDFGFYVHKTRVIKSADNLVDLLKIGDIITLKWNDGLHLENEYILTESLLKNLKSIYVYGKNYKITTIELR